MNWFVGALPVLCLYYLLRFYLLRREIARLHEQIEGLNENARYGKRLYLEGKDQALAKAATAINQMVDEYEGKLRSASEMERNIRYSISGISHDLRTPLTSLMGYLQLLSREALTEKQREYLDVIFYSAGMLRDLTENFYELSCLDLGENLYSILSLNLEHVTCECLLGFYENFSQRHIEIDIKDAETPPIVLADPVALKRVLYNIIQNLLRYAQGVVSVAFSEEDGFFAVTIGNETKDALPDEINRVFERFYTTDPSRKDRSLGLGLYVSRKLVTGMGGSMIAYNDQQKFFITVKLPKSNEEE